MRHGRLSSESGFTLIELLVVVLILGIIAAIAIPNFLNQQAKAHDATAKSAARNAQSAMQVYEMDHGSFQGADQDELAKIDGSLGSSEIKLDVLQTPAAGGYTFRVTTPGSEPLATFTVELTHDGDSIRTCNLPGQGGCKDDGNGNGVW